jgi:hypothetical protein
MARNTISLDHGGPNGLLKVKDTVPMLCQVLGMSAWSDRGPRFRAPISKVALLASLAAIVTIQFAGLLFSLQNQMLTSQFGTANFQWIYSTANDSSRSTNASVEPLVRRANRTIFYNIYIPDDRDTGGAMTAHSFHIVSEQLQQIATSYAGGFYLYGNESVSDLPEVHVYYLTVGPADILPESLMNNSSDFCGAYPHFRCHHLGHHTSGFEDLTLDHLHRYCGAHPSERVVYLHNKGSFHPVDHLSLRWRHILTLASTAKECIEPPDDKCNVCGLLWYTVFAVMVPGNMFTAKCEYVAKLLSPLEEFASKHQMAVGEGLLLRTRRHLVSNVFGDRSEVYGFDRYLAEQWIGTFLHPLRKPLLHTKLSFFASMLVCSSIFAGSHPDLIPCEMKTEGAHAHIAFDDPTLQRAKWSLAPNRAGFDYFSEFFSDADLAEREYFYLSGNLLKWYHIYGKNTLCYLQFESAVLTRLHLVGKYPAEDSWVWKFFPFGDRWLKAVQTHGKDAVDHATSQYYYSIDGDTERRSAFHNHSVDTDLSFGRNQTKNLAVFLHVTADSDQVVVGEQLRAAQALATQQMQKVSLFFSIVGESGRKEVLGDYIRAVCQDKRHSKIACKPLPPFSVPYEGETLRQLHLYCRSYPNSVVSYVQSDLPSYMKQHIGDPSKQFNLLLHLSRAALSSECVEAVRRDGEDSFGCNTCGLVFYKLWTLFYPGNMFTASCTYVNDLLPPNTFEQQMEEYVKAALLARLLGYLQSGVFLGHFTRKSIHEPYGADLPELWGLDRFSVDFWLGSHPKLNPCDVSGNVAHNLSYWHGLTVAAASAGKERHYGPVVEAPTHDGSPFHFNVSRYKATLSDDSIRMREVSFLAGHLARYNHLYGSVPASNSRVWSFFPDSEYWKGRTVKGGRCDFNGSASDPNSCIWRFFQLNGE